ncbi:TetR family transcriptional regulator [Streptomyces sp. NPDC097640]|uniref:TetR family transcriptional regulator n=1 Tax=Streptomyces sp. NPDC097640 TaxID=3157229 RepID=UPI0033242ECB
MASQSEGLRDRRRRETRHDIHTAALRLVREHGFDKITVDMISAEAGVSPRTFFNYFPNKESALLPGPTEVPPALAAEFVGAGAASPQEVLADVTRLLVREMTDNPPERTMMHDVFELAGSHPAVLAALLARMEGFQKSIAGAVAQRMGQRPEDEMPNLIAALALTAVRTGLEHWSREDPHSAEDDSPVPYVERALELLRSLSAD